jgi:hypothetical protein
VRHCKIVWPASWKVCRYWNRAVDELERGSGVKEKPITSERLDDEDTDISRTSELALSLADPTLVITTQVITSLVVKRWLNRGFRF